MVDRTDNIEAEGDRRRRNMEIPADLESRFLRVGDKLYRSAHDKEPVATITADRIKAKDQAALPDLIRLAKENGWTSLKISGDEEFKRAAFLAASAQGLKIDGYTPDSKTQAAADRELARNAGRPATNELAPRTTNQSRDTKEQSDPRSDLAERFRRQTDVQNAKDPELRSAKPCCSRHGHSDRTLSQRAIAAARVHRRTQGRCRCAHRTWGDNLRCRGEGSPRSASARDGPGPDIAEVPLNRGR
jgi:hypothetical protein